MESKLAFGTRVMIWTSDSGYFGSIEGATTGFVKFSARSKEFGVRDSL